MQRNGKGQYEKKHGESGNTRSKTYRSWESMKRRCLNPNAHNYKHYGGRGITICERWRNSYLDFLADMGDRPEGMTLDRIDSHGNYEPGNCKWATQRDQMRNTTRSRHYKQAA